MEESTLDRLPRALRQRGRPAHRPRPRWRRHTIGNLLAPLGLTLVLLGIWELVARLSLLPSPEFPTMSGTAAEAFRLIRTQQFWSAVGQTMDAWVIGMGVALVLAVPIGIAIGSNYPLYRSFRLVIEFLRPVPSVALIPLAIVLTGAGITTKVGLAVFGAFWPLLLQCYYGIQDLDPVAQDTARSFGLGTFERLWRITLPSTVPYIATGVRIASVVVLIVVVAAEIVIGAPGLGRELLVAQSGGAYEKEYALTVLIGVLAWVINIAFTRTERRVLRWHPSQRAVAA